MVGMKLAFKLPDFAKAHNMGYGNFNLKDGSSVKLMSDLKNRITHACILRNGKLIKAEAAKGYPNIAFMLGRYENKAINPADISVALDRSFMVEA